MGNDTFDTNILRMIAAELYLSASMTASREMFGKGYFSLSVAEKSAVDGAVLTTVGSLFQTITPDLLREKMTAQPVGFQQPQKTDAGSVSTGSQTPEKKP